MPPKPLSLPQLGAVVAGNALEFYDFLTFSFFAVQIGAVFFPGHDATGSLLLTLATFGVGFLTRPLGGLVFGHFGDRIGRKQLLMLSLLLMGGSSFLIGLTPGNLSRHLTVLEEAGLVTVEKGLTACSAEVCKPVRTPPMLGATAGSLSRTVVDESTTEVA